MTAKTFKIIDYMLHPYIFHDSVEMRNEKQNYLPVLTELDLTQPLISQQTTKSQVLILLSVHLCQCGLRFIHPIALILYGRQVACYVLQFYVQL